MARQLKDLSFATDFECFISLWTSLTFYRSFQVYPRGISQDAVN